MEVQQFVLAYQVEQDRLRALLPQGFESLRPVVRINAERRQTAQGEELYLEVNTPVASRGKRGWLNAGRWQTPDTELSYTQSGPTHTFRTPFLTLTHTQVGLQGGCPAEGDNQGCFYLQPEETFVPTEKITANRDFSDVSFRWTFTPADAQGQSHGEGSRPAYPTDPKITYPKHPLTPEALAAIPCQQVLGAYTVTFLRI